jgi:hypothetical protein
MEILGWVGLIYFALLAFSFSLFPFPWDLVQGMLYYGGIFYFLWISIFFTCTFYVIYVLRICIVQDATRIRDMYEDI